MPPATRSNAMVGLSLITRISLDSDQMPVTVTLVLPPSPGILVTSSDSPPKYLDLASVARMVLDFGDIAPPPHPSAPPLR